MTSYFIELNEYKPQNRKCAEMAEFANQFGNTLCPDKISFDAFKTELEAKVKELNEKYPKTMPLKISSGSGFIHIDQDTKTHNNGCDKPVAYFFIYRVKRIEEIKKEQEEIQGMFLQESKFKPGDLVQVDYKISNATFKVRGWIFRITFWRNRPYYHLNLPKKDGSRGLRVKSICDGVLESITSISHIKLEDLKGGAK